MVFIVGEGTWSCSPVPHLHGSLFLSVNLITLRLSLHVLLVHSAVSHYCYYYPVDLQRNSFGRFYFLPDRSSTLVAIVRQIAL